MQNIVARRQPRPCRQSHIAIFLHAQSAQRHIAICRHITSDSTIRSQPMRSPSPTPPAAHFTRRPPAIQLGVRGHSPFVVRSAPRRQRRGYPRRTGTACPTPSAKTSHPRPPTLCRMSAGAAPLAVIRLLSHQGTSTDRCHSIAVHAASYKTCPSHFPAQQILPHSPVTNTACNRQTCPVLHNQRKSNSGMSKSKAGKPGNSSTFDADNLCGVASIRTTSDPSDNPLS